MLIYSHQFDGDYLPMFNLGKTIKITVYRPAEIGWWIMTKNKLDTLMGPFASEAEAEFWRNEKGYIPDSWPIVYIDGNDAAAVTY